VVVPTTTLPKVAGVGVIDSPGVCALVAVPVRTIWVGELEELVTRETLPVTDPAAAGEKFILKALL
jgi:hypothetical protein